MKPVTIYTQRSKDRIMKRTPVILILTLIMMLINCGSEQQNVEIPVIEEDFLSDPFDADNIDSPAVWHGPQGENWLLATAKEGDVIVIYDAETGKTIRRACSPGTEKGQLERPNGILVLDNLAMVVERDNHRIQVFTLPEFEHFCFIGENELKRPYGITAYKDSEGLINIYVTDNYENEDGTLPADIMLSNRVHHYTLAIDDRNVSVDLIKKFGEITGPGILKKVETIYADPENGNLLICEELENQTCIILYDLSGKFLGRKIGMGLFEYEAEGIALYDKGDANGYWICTDQDLRKNTFHVLDRKTFELLGSFRGIETRNTDGVALTQKRYGKYSAGVFFAVNNDKNVGAFSLDTVFDSLGLSK